MNQYKSLRPGVNDLWFLPLGGTGEIGMNLNLYGHNDTWLMVDCGVTFQAPLCRADDYREGVKRFDVVAADPNVIENRRDMLCGIILTHAHEDHLGAVPALWERFKCPVYTTAFTAEVLKRKLYNSDIAEQIQIVIVDLGQTLDIGPFTITWMDITHSIPEAQALYIQTPAGSIFHTGDWKIDRKPIIGDPFNSQLFKQLKSLKPTAMVCDSTNALRLGYSVSESDCETGLFHYVKQAQGRVVVTCFASNVARLITLAKIAQRTERYVCLLGRSLENMYSIAKYCGIWPADLKVINRRHMGYLPKHEVLILATGSQGERRAALSKLAANEHRDCDLEAGDCVIFSTIVIPGNEKAIQRVVNQLNEREVQVIQSESCAHTIHASGHPCASDLHDMYSWVEPKIAIPVHGEPQHLTANADIARAAGVPAQLTGLNGDLFQLAPLPSIKRKIVSEARIEVTQPNVAQNNDQNSLKSRR